MIEERTFGQTEQRQLDTPRTEVISDLGRFNAIAGEWDALVERSGVESLFLSHDWIRTWWEAFGKDRDLYVITVRTSGRIIGAAPMMRSRERIYGIKLDSISSIYNPHTPRFDFIADGGSNETVNEAIWNHLSATGCEMIALKQVLENSATVPDLGRHATNYGWLSGQWVTPPSPYIPLSCTYEDLLGRLKGGYRYNLRKRYERLSKIGPVDIEVITDRASVRDAMLDGLRIEAAAWKGRKGTAIVSDTAVTEFYSRLAERQADAGQLRLSFLRVGGKRISFNYVLCVQNKIYGVKIGYDPEYHTYSPGNMHLNLILQEACAEGLTEYDFLGVNDDWKLDWTKSVRGHRWLFLFRNAMWPRLCHCLKFTVTPTVRPRVQRLCTYLHGRV